jgi:hypothetical protein
MLQGMKQELCSATVGAIDTDPQARISELSRLVPLWPAELADTSREGRLKVLSLIERAIRAERRRGHAGHWAYDLARHAALFRWYKRERAALGLGAKDAPARNRKSPPDRAGS